MADTKISALAAGSPAAFTDLVPIARGGSNYSLQLSDVYDGHVIARLSTPVRHDSSTATGSVGPVTLLSFSVPANALGTSRTLRVRIYGHLYADTANITEFFSMTLGGTNFIVMSATGLPSNALNNVLPFVIEASVSNQGATNSQWTTMSIFRGVSTAQTAGNGGALTGWVFSNSGLAIDTTATQTFVISGSVTATFANTNPLSGCWFDHVDAEIV